MQYKRWIEDRLSIVNKRQEDVNFIPNKAQVDFLEKTNTANKSIILKARQIGFSSIILALFTCDFILKENTYNVVVADVDDNATALLSRVKYYVDSYKRRTGREVPLKYNSKTELYNPVMNSYYKIGSAKNTQFGRSRTITNLHLSEFSFYPDSESLLASSLQAVVPGGRVIIETTANGFNFFKSLWDDAERRGFSRFFYGPEWEYEKDLLEVKKKELGRLYDQEYPSTPELAFLTSGDLYFDKEGLRYQQDSAKDYGQFNISI